MDTGCGNKPYRQISERLDHFMLAAGSACAGIYLFLYSPAFLLLSLCGYEAIWKKGIALLRRRFP